MKAPVYHGKEDAQPEERLPTLPAGEVPLRNHDIIYNPTP